MSKKFPTHAEKMRALARIRGLKVKQDLMCLRENGYVINGSEMMTAVEWREKFRKSVHMRIQKQELATRKHHACIGYNVERAGWIVRDGEKSNWFDARQSTERAGTDYRGIVYSILKWKREGRLPGNAVLDAAFDPFPHPEAVSSKRRRASRDEARLKVAIATVAGDPVLMKTVMRAIQREISTSIRP